MTAATSLQVLENDGVTSALAEIPGWEIVASGKAINRHFKFSNYAEALAFVNRLSEHAEATNHHPDITMGWGYVGVTLATHDAGGITENDINLAKKINSL